jgi:hypothetical protein
MLREQNIQVQNSQPFTKRWTHSCITLQALFQRVTGSPLTLSLRRTGLLQLAFSLFLAAVTVGLQIYEPYWPMWRMPPFYAVLLQYTVFTTFRKMTFSALQITSATLVRRFKVINKMSVIFAFCLYHTQNLKSRDLIETDCYESSKFQIATT